MKEDLLKNQEHIRACIQYEVLQEKPVFEAYKSFCKILGDDAIEYKEFDFWYYRLLNGNYDLKHDRSKDPVTRELSDMPLEIAEKIFGCLEKRERYVLPHVAKSFANIIYYSNLLISELKVTIKMELIELTFNDEKIAYEKYRTRTKIFTTGPRPTFSESQYEDLAFAKLERILINPRLRFEKVAVTFGDVDDKSDLVIKQCRRIENVFQSLNHQIHSESLHLSIKCAKQLTAVLPYFKPGVLREIDIYGLIMEPTKFNCGQLVNMDQFKQAKSFTLAGCYFTASHDHLFHFEHVEVDFTLLKIDDILRFRDAFLASKNFKSCTLVSYVDVDSQYDEIREITEKPYPIPGTQKQLSIYVNRSVVFFDIE